MKKGNKLTGKMGQKRRVDFLGDHKPSLTLPFPNPKSYIPHFLTLFYPFFSPLITLFSFSFFYIFLNHPRKNVELQV